MQYTRRQIYSVQQVAVYQKPDIHSARGCSIPEVRSTQCKKMQYTRSQIYTVKQDVVYQKPDLHSATGCSIPEARYTQCKRMQYTRSQTTQCKKMQYTRSHIYTVQQDAVYQKPYLYSATGCSIPEARSAQCNRKLQYIITGFWCIYGLHEVLPIVE
jgi:hypothetical protein